MRTLTASTIPLPQDSPRHDPPADRATPVTAPSSQGSNHSPRTTAGADVQFEEDHPRDGLYGPMHWLDDRGITALLAPYVSEGWGGDDYARIGGLEGADARRLLSLLPRLARGDRQNNAPTIATLLRAAASVDGLTLEGYVIRAPRRDERVSIDTVCVPESAISAITGSPAPEQACPWINLPELVLICSPLPRHAKSPDRPSLATAAPQQASWRHACGRVRHRHGQRRPSHHSAPARLLRQWSDRR